MLNILNMANLYKIKKDTINPNLKMGKMRKTLMTAISLN